MLCFCRLSLNSFLHPFSDWHRHQWSILKCAYIMLIVKFILVFWVYTSTSSLCLKEHIFLSLIFFDLKTIGFGFQLQQSSISQRGISISLYTRLLLSKNLLQTGVQGHVIYKAISNNKAMDNTWVFWKELLKYMVSTNQLTKIWQESHAALMFWENTYRKRCINLTLAVTNWSLVLFMHLQNVYGTALQYLLLVTMTDALVVAVFY